MENKYYLAIETKPRKYFPINLLDLDIAKGFTSTVLAELDAFTVGFTKDEIFYSIKNANLLDITKDMPLVVIYFEKSDVRKIDALTKEINNNFNMWEVIKNNYNDKIFLNKVYNYLNKKIDDNILNELKSAKDFKEFGIAIAKMSYFYQRKLYFYLYEK